MATRPISIAVDGYSSCGKSTLARDVARRLGYLYLDTGAMYRAVALALLRSGLSLTELGSNEEKLARFLEINKVDVVQGGDGEAQVLLNGNVVNVELRSLEVSRIASLVSSWPLVRRTLQAVQKAIGERKGVVMDGRDIGTVVMPHAELKIFVVADFPVRVQRRRDELRGRGIEANDEEVAEDLRQRDFVNTHRAADPLRRAPDARLLDTSQLTREQQCEVVCNWVSEIVEKDP